MLNTIINGATSFVINHWIAILVVLITVGVVIRIAYYASNPIVALIDLKDFLIKHWKETIVILLLVVIGLYIFNLKVQIAQKNNQLIAAEASIATLKETNQRLEAVIKQANTMVERFDKFTADTRVNFSRLNGDISKNNKTLSHQLQSILDDKKPQTCEEALEYLIDANKGYTK